MAVLLMFAGTLGLIAGLLSLVKPIARLGIRSRRRAAQVTIGALVLSSAGAAIAGPEADVDAASIAHLSDTAQTTATSPSPAATTTSTLAATSTVPATTGRPVDVVATVISVTDGDTIRVRMPDGTVEPVRLIGIDAPEPGEDGSAKASSMLWGLIEGEDVTLTVDVSDRDRFDRLLRYVWLDDRLINEELVAAGVVTARLYPPDTAYAERLQAAETEAQLLAIGMWTTTTSTSTTVAITTTTAMAFVSPTTTEASANECHPSYIGECVPFGVEDVDCRGGSGNGPYYVGRVQVVGYDEYGLDGDSDGIGCESS